MDWRTLVLATTGSHLISPMLSTFKLPIHQLSRNFGLFSFRMSVFLHIVTEDSSLYCLLNILWILPFTDSCRNPIPHKVKPCSDALMKLLTVFTHSLFQCFVKCVHILSSYLLGVWFFPSSANLMKQVWWMISILYNCCGSTHYDSKEKV